MSCAILGISAYYHDSAAALVVDGKIVAAAQEERFTRIKHDASFPTHAIAYCLAQAKLPPEAIDYVGFYEKPLLKFDRLLATYLAFAPQGFRSFKNALPIWLKQKLHLPREMRAALQQRYQKNFIFTQHHEAHAASAFFPSPFAEAALLTLDGVGEWATASCGFGKADKITLHEEMHFPHSLGLLYSAFTYFCGFKVNSGEYKLMGLAPYGEPKYVQKILDELIDLKADGSLRLNLKYFNYCQGLTMTNAAFAQWLGGAARTPEGPLTQREMDLAASIQVVTEMAMLRAAKHVHQLTGSKNLCLAGGVALNCVGNGKILRQGPFENIWIQPAAGDAGGALGTALFIWHQLLNQPRSITPNLQSDQQYGSLLGPQYSDAQIRNFLDEIGASYQYFEDEQQLCQHVAQLLDQAQVVGWFAGRMEFGPRALGARSILGDARNPEMQAVMNLKIKFRESFRPFAPVVLADQVDQYFETRPAESSPYMLLVAPVAQNLRQPVTSSDVQGFDKLKQQRSRLPAITHVDYSARIQTVDATRHGRFYQLLKSFEKLTGTGVLINTSFNVRGEPMVCTPADAYRCFMATHIDVLVLEKFVLLKTQQPKLSQAAQQQYLQQFSLD